jgi:hypothetical protein
MRVHGVIMLADQGFCHLLSGRSHDGVGDMRIKCS